MNIQEQPNHENLVEQFIMHNEDSFELLDYMVQLLCIKNKRRGRIVGLNSWLKKIQIISYGFLNFTTIVIKQ